MSSLPPAIVVLAAGESARMGRPKQLLQHAGKTLVRRAAETALAAAEGAVFVVLGAQEEAIREELSGLAVKVVSNPDWQEGMASSIRAGIKAAADAGAVLFMLCDQPLLTTATLGRLLEAHHQLRATVACCRYHGTLGVPALFDRLLFPDLLALQGNQGARKIVEVYKDTAFVVPFEGGATDIDTPEQYARLVQQSNRD